MRSATRLWVPQKPTTQPMLSIQDDGSIRTGHGPVAGSVKPMNRATASMVDSVLDWTVFFRVCVLAPDLGGVRAFGCLLY